MQVFNQLKTHLMIRTNSGKLKHLETEVIYSWDHDDSIPDFDYGNDLDNEREMNRFHSGELMNLILKVECKALGFSGTEYLGQCFIPSKNMNAELMGMSYEYDLKNEACKSLMSELKGNYSTLKNLFEIDPT